MRVLLYVDHDLSLPGGVETHVRELALGLANRGHEVEVFGRPAMLPPFTMVSRVEPDRYDVFHHHDGFWPDREYTGPRYVRTFHLCVAAKMEAYVRIGRLQTLANLENWRVVREEARSCRRAGRFIVVSERVRDDLARRYGLDPRRAEVISNGVRFAEPGETRDAIRHRYEILSGAPVLLTVGRDDFVKGHGLLARAWARSDAAGRGAWWVTAGGAEPRREPGRLVTGPIGHGEVAAWIRAADLGALPSYYEGCSVALLEMLAGGLFSLSHDVGNAAQVLRAGENGRLIERSEPAWSDAIAEMLAHPPARPAAGLASEYAWDALTARVEEVYRRAVAEAGGRAG